MNTPDLGKVSDLWETRELNQSRSGNTSSFPDHLSPNSSSLHPSIHLTRVQYILLFFLPTVVDSMDSEGSSTRAKKGLLNAVVARIIPPRLLGVTGRRWNGASYHVESNLLIRPPAPKGLYSSPDVGNVASPAGLFNSQGNIRQFSFSRINRILPCIYSIDLCVIYE